MERILDNTVCLDKPDKYRCIRSNRARLSFYAKLETFFRTVCVCGEDCGSQRRFGCGSGLGSKETSSQDFQTFFPQPNIYE